MSEIQIGGQTLATQTGTADPVIKDNVAVGGHAVTVKPSSPVAGQFYFDTVQKSLFIYEGSKWMLLSSVSDFGTATGGTISTAVSGYKIHTFTSTSATNFVVSTNPIVADILICGGGGAGGSHHGGGGGAGELILGYGIKFWPGTYTATCGAGGTGVAYAGDGSSIGGSGSISELRDISDIGWGHIKAGGGGGGSTWGYETNRYGTGGSCGGPAGGGNAVIVGSEDNEDAFKYGKDSTNCRGGALLRFKNDSGAGSGYGSPHYGKEGGGGAGGPGGAGLTTNLGGAGGHGMRSDITGTDTFYCAGGGGCTYNATDAAAAHPDSNSTTGQAKGVNTGSAGIDATTYGGGGGGYDRSGSPDRGGHGRQGVIIIRYRDYT